MANICDNKFFISCDNEDTLDKIAEKLDKRVDDMLSKWEDKLNKLTTNKDGADAPESPEDNNNDESEDNENGDN